MFQNGFSLHSLRWEPWHSCPQTGNRTLTGYPAPDSAHVVGMLRLGQDRGCYVERLRKAKKQGIIWNVWRALIKAKNRALIGNALYTDNHCFLCSNSSRYNENLALNPIKTAGFIVNKNCRLYREQSCWICRLYREHPLVCTSYVKGAQNLYDFAPENYTILKLIAQKLYELKSSGRRIEAGFASYNFWAAKSKYKKINPEQRSL